MGFHSVGAEAMLPDGALDPWSFLSTFSYIGYAHILHHLGQKGCKLIGRTLQFNFGASILGAFPIQIPTSTQKNDLLLTILTQIVGLPTRVG